MIPHYGTVCHPISPDPEHNETSMLRPFSCFGLGMLFLGISPRLRMDVTNGIGAGAAAMSRYAPFSYVVSGIALIIFMMIAFRHDSRPR